MRNSFHHIRRDYVKSLLEEHNLPATPFDLFGQWLREAIAEGISDPTAMILSTATPEGMPSSRVVLLKDFSEDGICFFTNYESRKGREIFLNPHVALLFFWPGMERQIRIEGQVEKAGETESDQYFAVRPRDSQLTVWASPQSRIIPGYSVLENSLQHITKRFEDRAISRPPHWGGYRVMPQHFEFWQGRAARLHDRIQYRLKSHAWEISRLAP